MKLIFCIDKNKGMMLFGKRQSQDRLLRAYLLELVGEHKLWMSEYTAGQFEEKENLMVDNDYIHRAGAEDYCFVEDGGYDPACADEIILCHWNRQYQADVFFDIDLAANGFKRKSSNNIDGSSHEKITVEIYKRG